MPYRTSEVTVVIERCLPDINTAALALHNLVAWLIIKSLIMHDRHMLQLLPKLWTTILLTFLLMFMAVSLGFKCKSAYKAETRAKHAASAATDEQQVHAEAGNGDGGSTEEAMLREELQTASQLAAMSDGPAPVCHSGFDLRAGLSMTSSLMRAGSQQQRNSSTTSHSPAMDSVLVPLLAASQTDVEHDEALQEVLAAEMSHAPRLHLGLMLMLTGWVVAVGLAKGSLPCGSLQQWLLVCSIILPAAGTMWVMRQRVLRHATIKQRCGMEAHEGVRALALHSFIRCHYILADCVTTYWCPRDNYGTALKKARGQLASMCRLSITGTVKHDIYGQAMCCPCPCQRAVDVCTVGDPAT